MTLGIVFNICFSIDRVIGFLVSDELEKVLQPFNSFCTTNCLDKSWLPYSLFI